jgi:endonuclease/exonuclease/phosphatase family metal-dependent hydrolase
MHFNNEASRDHCSALLYKMLVQVVSFNVRYANAPDKPHQKWNVRLPLIKDAMSRIAVQLQADQEVLPDFLCVQEALKLQADDLEHTFPQYSRIGAFREGNSKGESCSIFYLRDKWALRDNGDFWLSDTPDVPGSITWGNACTRMCTWGIFEAIDSGKKLAVFNTHLDHVSDAANLKSVQLIAERLALHDSECLIVTGDFNCGKDSDVIQTLMSSAGLKDTFDESGCTDESFSFHGFQGDEFKGEDACRIDFILYKDNSIASALKCIKSFQWKEYEFDKTGKKKMYISDHYPVCSLLEI